MNETLINRITVNSEQCGGKPCVRNMRIRVVDVIALMANGLSSTEVLEELPDLTQEDIQACLMYAMLKLDHPVIKAA